MSEQKKGREKPRKRESRIIFFFEKKTKKRMMSESLVRRKLTVFDESGVRNFKN